MKIVLINGIAKSGKDTFIELFGSVVNVPVLNLSTIDPVREVSRGFGWNGNSKTDADRLLWSRLKKVWTEYNDGIFRWVTSEVQRNVLSYGFAFIHCREPEELERLRSYFIKTYRFCAALLVTREGLEVPDNPSDQSVLDFDYDYVVENNSDLQELRRSALEFYVSLQN